MGGCAMWTVEQRRAYERDGLRYPSDLTDEEWALVEPLIPPAGRGGRERTVDVREVLDGILHVLAADCRWCALPEDLPPRGTVHGHLTLRARDGTLGRPHHALSVQARRDRRQPGRRGRRRRRARVDPSGRDAGEEVEGKRRHVPVDTLGLPLTAVIHPADVQDRDGVLPVPRAARRPFPFVGVILAGGALVRSPPPRSPRPAAGGSRAARPRASCPWPSAGSWRGRSRGSGAAG